MATWREMSLGCRSSAKVLLSSDDEIHLRSSISRCYYAAYCAVAHILQGKVDFAYGGNNPTHEGLDTLIVNNLYQLPSWKRQFIRSMVRRLRTMRVAADYGVAESVDRIIALDALHFCNSVLEILLEE